MEQLTSGHATYAHDKSSAHPSNIVSDSLPILHRLRARIRAYAKLWCIAGAMTLLLSLPAMRESNMLLALTTIMTGLSVLFFAIIRILESRSVSAIIEVDRSDLRRKVWIGVNSVIFLTAFTIFLMSVFQSEPSFSPWTALPISTFLMIVSISPLWEWFFVFRVIRNNKMLLEDFNRHLQLFYKTDEERRNALLAIDALMMLESLRNKRVLSNTTYQVILRELLRLDPVI